MGEIGNEATILYTGDKNESAKAMRPVYYTMNNYHDSLYHLYYLCYPCQLLGFMHAKLVFMPIITHIQSGA